MSRMEIKNLLILDCPSLSRKHKTIFLVQVLESGIPVGRLSCAFGQDSGISDHTRARDHSHLTIQLTFLKPMAKCTKDRAPLILQDRLSRDLDQIVQRVALSIVLEDADNPP